MKIDKIFRTGCLIGAIAATPALSLGSSLPACNAVPAIEPTHAWDTPREGSAMLRQILFDASKVRTQADRLYGYSFNHGIDWQTHAWTLTKLKAEVNDMGANLCSLETIRTSLSPWEREATDRTAVLVREMAANTQMAIRNLNNNEERLWNSDYRGYTANLAAEGARLTQTIGEFEKLASVRRKEKNLIKDLGTNAAG